jgi:D-alanyl-lipoteichoic acid acyltransferase DltB (MBOAT superfamily)
LLFPTFTFAVFMLIVLPLSWWTMPHPTRWRRVMLLANYIFYAWWDPWFVLLLGGSTVLNQVLAHAIHRSEKQSRRKLLLATAVAGNVGILLYFKYWDFFASSVHNAFSSVGIPVSMPLLATVLPVGLSFYTFMALSYVIDTYRRELVPVSFSRFAVFLSFFPHLVAGPIVRPAELLPQMETPRDPRRVDTSRAFSLILVGLFLKVVLATACSPIVDQVFGTPTAHSAIETLVAIYAYAVQIFSDFCGYTSIAIGVALLLGFEFPQNFNNPYSATSLQDFWRRWHMTLSRWLRDYVYVPLGGNRHGSTATYRNLLVTMLIGGLWHGAAWTFVFWGGIHGVGLALERWRRERRQKLGIPEPRLTGRRLFWARFATFHLVCFAWVFFRATSFGGALSVLGRLFTGWGMASPAVTLPLLAAIAVGIGGQYVNRRTWQVVMVRLSTAPVVAQGVALGVLLMLINTLGPRGVAPFIYFRF